MITTGLCFFLLNFPFINLREKGLLAEQFCMPEFIDQAARIVFIPSAPRRIISLVPSQTELLADLGLEAEVVGITKFCVHPPEWFHHKTRVGGTKQLKLDIIRQLQPDLVIANKEENLQEQIETIQHEFPVWVSDVNNLDSAYDMIGQIGMITGKAEAANHIITRIKSNFSQIANFNEHQLPGHKRLSAVYLIWQKPYMSVGGDTFIHSMLELAGITNLMAGEMRYPEITVEKIKELNPTLLLLSSEPYPFSQKHVAEFTSLLPGVGVLLVDGEIFSWYGSRLLFAPAYFKSLREKIFADEW